MTTEERQQEYIGVAAMQVNMIWVRDRVKSLNITFDGITGFPEYSTEKLATLIRKRHPGVDFTIESQSESWLITVKTGDEA